MVFAEGRPSGVGASRISSKWLRAPVGFLHVQQWSARGRLRNQNLNEAS
jgi:hypothetical protein